MIRSRRLYFNFLGPKISVFFVSHQNVVLFLTGWFCALEKQTYVRKEAVCKCSVCRLLLQVGLVVSSKVPNRLLTGVKFLADGSQRIAATSYDCTILHLWHKL